MNKKFWLGCIVVFGGMAITDFLIHGVLLTSIYESPAVKPLFRPDMMNKMWIFYVNYLIMSLFFTLIFSKGYEGKGVSEGVRYGLYVGLLMATPMAYASYATYPIPYALAFQWFIYGVIQYVILGVLVAAVYGKKTSPAA
jgi:hypothetical protein